jgi:hypothetical protein
MKRTTAAASVLCLMFSLQAYAKCDHHKCTDYKFEAQPTVAESWLASHLYMGAYGGYGAMSGAEENDGNFAQGRLALGLNLYQYQPAMFGLEIGVQSGNTMRLQVSDAVLAALGGLPVQVTLQPFVDLLATVKCQISQRYPIIAFLKGGIAYRQMHFNDRISSSDSLQQVNGEVQVGLGYQVTRNATLSAFYQGIYSNNSANVTLDAAAENTFISQIPTQQAGFLGIEYNV